MAHQLLFLCLSIFLTKVSANNPTVRITATDPRINDLSGEIIQHRGKDVQFTCVVEDKPITAKVIWEAYNRNWNESINHISRATKVEDAFRWSVDRPSATSWRLRVQNVQDQDEAMYICKVEIVQNNFVQDSRMLRVVEKPQIKDLDTSTDMIKKTGESATLECMATGRPEPVIRWTRMAGELLPNGGSVLQANKLYIKEVKSNDAGYYKCSSTNFAGSDQRLILLTVKFKPEVDTSNPVVKQKVGYVKQLVCNVKGYPLPKAQEIGWKKEGLSIRFDSRVQIRNIVGAYNRITSIIDIRGVQSKDYGRYECAASNERGKGMTTIELVSSPAATADRSHRIVSGVPVLLMNIGLTICMLLFTCLLQRLGGNLH